MKHCKRIKQGEKKICITSNCMLLLTFIVEHRPWSSIGACACEGRTDSSRLCHRACADRVADPGDLVGSGWWKKSRSGRYGTEFFLIQFVRNGIRNSYKNHQTLFALGSEPVLWPMGSGSTQSGAGRGHSSCLNTRIRIAKPWNFSKQFAGYRFIGF